MKTVCCAAVLALLVLTGFLEQDRAFAQSEGKAAIGLPLKEFTLREMRSGKTVKLSQYRGKPLVLVFMANRCGMTWTYEKEIGKLIKESKTKGYSVLLVHSNFEESDAELKSALETRNIPAPILDDKKTQSLALYLGAKATPTFYITDKRGILRYSGGYDNLHELPHPFPDALAAVLSNKPVKTPTARAVGCGIPFRQVRTATL